MKKTILTLFTIALILSSCKETASKKGADPNQEFDIVILNGRVMDPETNFDGIRNVGVKDGKIAIITESEIKGKETINAEGHVVAPGFIETKMTEVLAEEVRESYMVQVPLRKFGSPKDIAHACLFLSSNKASYITGQVIVIDGGNSISEQRTNR